MRKLLVVVLAILLFPVFVSSVLAALPGMGDSGAVDGGSPGWDEAGSGNASGGPGGAPNGPGGG